MDDFLEQEKVKQVLAKKQWLTFDEAQLYLGFDGEDGRHRLYKFNSRYGVRRTRRAGGRVLRSDLDRALFGGL